MRANKGLLACAISCVVIVILGIALLIGIGFWITEKGHFDQTQTILDNEHDYFVQLKLGEEEKELVAFFQDLSSRSNRDNPLFKKFPFLQGMAKKDTERDFRKLLPLRIEIQGTPSSQELQVSVGFSVYNRIASLIYYFMTRTAEKNGDLRNFQDKKYLVINKGHKDQAYVSLDQNVAFFSNQPEALEAMFMENPVTQDMHSSSPGLQGLDLHRPVYGYLQGSAIYPGLPHFFNLFKDESFDWLSSEWIQRIGWDMKVGDNQKSLAGQIFIDLTSEDARDIVNTNLETLIEKVEDYPEKRAEISFQKESTFEGFRIQYQISNLRLPNQTSGVHFKRSKTAS